MRLVHFNEGKYVSVFCNFAPTGSRADGQAGKLPPVLSAKHLQCCIAAVCPAKFQKVSQSASAAAEAVVAGFLTAARASGLRAGAAARV